jgi:hypothetical protein
MIHLEEHNVLENCICFYLEVKWWGDTQLVRSLREVNLNWNLRYFGILDKRQSPQTQQS